MIKIVCINGSPGTGKNTVSEMLREIHNGVNVGISSIADPLDKIAMRLLGVTETQYLVLRESQKDRVLEEFDINISLRQLLINISEDLIKPSLGETWLAKEFLIKAFAVRDLYQVIVLTSVGFQVEFDFIKKILKSESIPVRLINLQREGCNYDNDSREDVSDGEDTIVIHNDGSLEELNEMLKVEMFNV